MVEKKLINKQNETALQITMRWEPRKQIVNCALLLFLQRLYCLSERNVVAYDMEGNLLFQILE